MDDVQLIALDDIEVRYDPRLGKRDKAKIAEYAEIIDDLPPIVLNQDSILIDGMHRKLAAEKANRTEIAYTLVETKDETRLIDLIWESNLKHGVQYTRGQRQTHGLKLHDRGLHAKEIADRVGVSINTIYNWTKAQRDKATQEREQAVIELAGEGKTQQEIADELGVRQQTISRIVTQNPNIGKMSKLEETPAEPTLQTSVKPEVPPENPVTDPEPPTPDEPLLSMLEPRPAPVPVPPAILETARTVMPAFTETHPEGFVAKLQAAHESMTITDESLSTELERELLQSAAAICLWQELMVWYHGAAASAFADAFATRGDVFVRGRTGQWSIVAVAASKLRSIIRRLTT